MSNRLLPSNLFTKAIMLSLVLLGFATHSWAQAKYSLNDVRSILNDNIERLDLPTADLEEMRISDQYTDQHNGVTHIYLQQQHQGIDILNATIGLHLDANQEVKFLTNHFFAHKNRLIRSKKVSLDAEEAVKRTCQSLGLTIDQLKVIKAKKTADQAVTFDKANVSIYDIPASLVYQPVLGGLELAWKVEIYTTDQQHYYVTKLNAANGEVLDRHDLVVSCKFSNEDHVHGASCTSHISKETTTFEEAIPTTESGFDLDDYAVPNFYRVYDAPVEAPSFGERSLVGTAGDPVASPLGWHNDGILDHFITKGNNVFAYHDPGPLSTPVPAVGGLPGQSPLVFDYSVNFNLPPLFSQPAAITNLFYWNNLIHDIFYHYGFTEPAGNFQNTNLGKGGAGLDAVLAEAQDGSGVDNANFLTLPDGLPGRMQMFLWTTALPLLDGDYDNGVIAHEYGHGISTRLTGGPGATCLGGDEQGGEGWSDYFGLMLTLTEDNLPIMKGQGRGIGTYVLNEPTNGLGIRPARYTTDLTENTYTYANLNDGNISVPHGVGFIWCTMLWEMTSNLIDIYGFDSDIVNGTGGNNIALQLVMDGLKLQPCNPTFVEMRDAILAADQILYNGAHQCVIWEAFAKRGLGFSAQSGSNTRGDEVAAFDMPPLFCQPIINMNTAVTEIANDGEQVTIAIELTNNAIQAISNIQLSNTLPNGLSFVSASAPASVNGNLVSFGAVSVPANSTKTITITASVNTGTNAALLFRDDMEADPFNWSSSAGLSPFVWTDAEAFSGDKSWFVADPTFLSNQTLTLNQTIPVTAGTHIRFAHRYNTEATFDAGVFETSTNGGQSWNDAGALFVENGYTDLVPLANNPLINGAAFGGESNGYVVSMADLSPLAGQDVSVRFRFSSDVFSGGEGWYIDNFEVVNDPTILTTTTTFSMANGFVSSTEEDKLLVVGSSLNAAAGTMRNTLEQAQVAESELFGAGLDMLVAPNPATDMVNLRFTGTIDGPIRIELTNLQGQVLQQRMFDTSNGGFDLDMNVSELTSGAYIIRATDRTQMITTKLIIR